MNENDLKEQLDKLIEESSGSTDPQHKKLVQLAKQAKANRAKLEKSISSLQDSLDHLRVCIKYQLFDLEATRRENSYLRKLLEERNGLE